MRNHAIPFTYTKAYGVQSEISYATVNRVAGQEVNFHRNVNTYHRDMMFKINSLCREQKRLKEYRRQLLKRKWHSSDLVSSFLALGGICLIALLWKINYSHHHLVDAVFGLPCIMYPISRINVKQLRDSNLFVLNPPLLFCESATRILFSNSHRKLDCNLAGHKAIR